MKTSCTMWMRRSAYDGIWGGFGRWRIADYGTERLEGEQQDLLAPISVRTSHTAH
jgi:hypothetical protein